MTASHHSENRVAYTRKWLLRWIKRRPFALFENQQCRKAKHRRAFSRLCNGEPYQPQDSGIETGMSGCRAKLTPCPSSGDRSPFAVCRNAPSLTSARGCAAVRAPETKSRAGPDRRRRPMLPTQGRLSEADHFFCLTTHTTRATTTITSRIGIHIPPYPPIQPPPDKPPFIMLPLCAKDTPVANRNTIPTPKANKILINFPY